MSNKESLWGDIYTSGKKENSASRAVFTILGATNHSEGEREDNDFYATEPNALSLLLDIETFNPLVWECACGKGHLSEVLKQRGYTVKSTDLIDRGYGQGGVNFLNQTEPINADIITNPPFKYAKEFVEHAMTLIPENNRIALFLKLTFLESQTRRELFEKFPPEYIYVSSSRLQCAKNGDFNLYGHGTGTAIAYAWFIWRKGFAGEPKIRWFN